MLKIKNKNIQPIQLIAYSDKWTSYTSTKQMKYTKDAQDWKTKLNICNDGYINGNMSGLDIIEDKVTCIV